MVAVQIGVEYGGRGRVGQTNTHNYIISRRIVPERRCNDQAIRCSRAIEPHQGFTLHPNLTISGCRDSTPGNDQLRARGDIIEEGLSAGIEREEQVGIVARLR